MIYHWVAEHQSHLICQKNIFIHSSVVLDLSWSRDYFLRFQSYLGLSHLVSVLFHFWILFQDQSWIIQINLRSLHDLCFIVSVTCRVGLALVWSQLGPTPSNSWSCLGLNTLWSWSWLGLGLGGPAYSTDSYTVNVCNVLVMNPLTYFRWYKYH